MSANQQYNEEATFGKKRGEKGKVKMMTREAVRQQLISMGVEEPSEEAITNFLNSVSKDIKASEEKAAKYKADSDRVKELEKQLDALNTQNLSDVEKANKATEEALKEVDNLRKTVTRMQLQKELAEIGIIGDDAEDLFTKDGSLNVSKLGEIVSGREKKAVADYEKQALESTPSPEGGAPEPETDSPDIAYAKEYVAKAKGSNNAQSIVDSYT